MSSIVPPRFHHSLCRDQKEDVVATLLIRKESMDGTTTALTIDTEEEDISFSTVEEDVEKEEERNRDDRCVDDNDKGKNPILYGDETNHVFTVYLEGTPSYRDDIKTWTNKSRRPNANEDEDGMITELLIARTYHTCNDGVVTKKIPNIIKVAILGCGMMGQEHCSYIMGYYSSKQKQQQVRIDYLCDPHRPSIDQCLQVMKQYYDTTTVPLSSGSGNVVDGSTKKNINFLSPTIVTNEKELLQNYVHEIDLLVIATPNYLHTPSILQWGQYEHLTILVEKPVATSQEQHDMLHSMQHTIKAKIWVGMEYRFIPAITKLIELIPSVVGDIQMVTIRENRYPFLHKVQQWNRDIYKTGDSLVEKWYVMFVSKKIVFLVKSKQLSFGQQKKRETNGINGMNRTFPLIISFIYLFIYFSFSYSTLVVISLI
jgi:Oxidoreductase family, NAD-binding Rossmann fold